MNKNKQMKKNQQKMKVQNLVPFDVAVEAKF